MQKLLIIFSLLFLFSSALSVENPQKISSVLKGPYLGQKPPGKTPEIFAPGIISTGTSEACSGWGGWTEPKPIGPPINTKYHDSYPCLAASGNLYFFSRKPGGLGKSDIYMSKFVDYKFKAPVNLGSNLNTEYHEWDTYIAPDESYLIYCSMMPGGLGDDDLYITFKQSDGS